MTASTLVREFFCILRAAPAFHEQARNSHVEKFASSREIPDTFHFPLDRKNGREPALVLVNAGAILAQHPGHFAFHIRFNQFVAQCRHQMARPGGAGTKQRANSRCLAGPQAAKYFRATKWSFPSAGFVSGCVNGVFCPLFFPKQHWRSFSVTFRRPERRRDFLV